MNDVYLCKSVVMTAFGPTVDDLWEGLMAGRSALREVTSFATTHYVSNYAGTMDWLPDNVAGRTYAILDRLLEEVGDVPEGTQVILSTTKGSLDKLQEFCRTRSVCPIDGLPPDLLRRVAAQFPNLTVGFNLNAACASSTVAIAHGAAAIAAGLCESVLVLAFDALSEFVFSGFSSLKGMAPDLSRPFDAGRDGLSLGEGGAGILIATGDAMERAGLQPMAKLIGWGCANDANHVTAPAKDAYGLRKAIGYALDRAGIGPEAVGGFNAHGTGTVYNDLMEITAVRHVFGEGALPAHSVKGAIGHTLGAAGAIELAVAAKSLKEGTIPPTVGLATPEPGSANLFSKDPQPLASDVVLTSNSGFGGINGALLVTQVDGKTGPRAPTEFELKANVLGVGWVSVDGMGTLGRDDLPEFFNGIFPKLSRSDVFDEPYKRFGRMDDFSKIGLGAIALALRDAGLEDWTEKRPMGIVAATDYGCINTDLEYFQSVVPEDGKYASPNLFAYTLPNCFLGEAAIRFGLAGGNFILNVHGQQLCTLFSVALEQLALGDCDRILVGVNNPELTMAPDEGRLAGSLFFVLDLANDDESVAVIERAGGKILIDGVAVSDDVGFLSRFRPDSAG